MTELKTLKDIFGDEETADSWGALPINDTLRQEAIKWVNSLYTTMQPEYEREMVVKWIKMFFNLTESDLK